MIKHRPHPRVSGYTLFHVLMAMPLFMVFTLLASKLFFAHVGLSQQAAEQIQTGDRMEHALFRLRADAWTANTLTVGADGQSAVFTGPNGQTTWRIADGTLTRADDDASEAITYADLGELFFTDAASALVVSIGPVPISCPLGQPGPITQAEADDAQ